jgi:hypothetical protein
MDRGCVNAIERVLRADFDRFMDRLSSSVPTGAYTALVDDYG